MAQRSLLIRKMSPKSLKLDKSFVGNMVNSVMEPVKKATKKQQKAGEKSRKPTRSNMQPSDQRVAPPKKTMMKSKSVISCSVLQSKKTNIKTKKAVKGSSK